MKIALCIIWVLVSSGIFNKSIESKKIEWLSVPSMISCVIAFIMWIIALVGAFS